MVTLFLLILLSFSIVVYLIAKIKKISVKQAFSIVADWIKQNWFSDTNTSYFVLYPSGFEQVFKIVVKHSRLDAEKTMWENRGSEIKIQILPQNEQSVVIAIEEAKTYIKTIAIAAQFPNIEVDAYDLPFVETSRLIVFNIATTAEQKKILQSNRYIRMHQTILESDTARQSFTDSELDKDMRGD